MGSEKVKTEKRLVEKGRTTSIQKAIRQLKNHHEEDQKDNDREQEYAKIE
jgi:hypothetical protein